MALNYGGMGSIFPQSDQLGVGLNPNPVHQIRIDAGEGIVIFSKTNKGSTDSAVESQFDSVKFAAGDLRNSDLISVKAFIDTPGGTAGGRIQLKVDATQIDVTTQLSNDLPEFVDISITEDPTDNTKAIVSRFVNARDAFQNEVATTAIPLGANWFIGEWTLNLRGRTDTEGEDFFWSWSVTIIKGER